MRLSPAVMWDISSELILDRHKKRPRCLPNDLSVRQTSSAGESEFYGGRPADRQTSSAGAPRPGSSAPRLEVAGRRLAGGTVLDSWERGHACGVAGKQPDR
jgi:hypothetical protein